MLWELLRLRLLAGPGRRRGRRNAYLRWRSETAYGRWEEDISTQHKRQDLFRLGAWIRRMRRNHM
ncbi:MAG: hypothetical protein D8M59_03580 [Planctomycetes bacterium]|nr:hypothetical protein [Planctomycetota bacterium]